MERIDTHLHLLYPEKFSYAWTAGFPALAGKAFRLPDAHALTGDRVSQSLFMEVDVPDEDIVAEARFFCKLCEDPANRMAGVIASCRPENTGMEAHLAATAHPFLRGFRRILHTQPDELSDSPLFRANVGLIGRAGFTFDLCILPKQHATAAKLIDACPDTRFILDHCGVPDLSPEGIAAWKSSFADLARRPNLACKISGIIAYAAPEAMTPELLRPVVEHAIACFGWDRVVWGSDWPVCNLTHGLKTWLDWSDALFAGCSAAEQAALFAGNARAIYRLPA